MLVKHDIIWTTPAPLWRDAVGDPTPAGPGFNQPAIFRFATDHFMDDFLAMIEKDPSQLRGLIARWETWQGAGENTGAVRPAPKFVLNYQRAKAATALRNKTRFHRLPLEFDAPIPTAAKTVKLYQPAHQRFYLVSACLVCQIAGLPDRTVDSGRNETATFVVRRLKRRSAGNDPLTLKNSDEYAFIVGPTGGTWQKVPDSSSTRMAGEEQLPLFAVKYVESDARQRRLFAGTIPVGKREAYLAGQERAAGASPDTPIAPTSPVTARKILLRATVGEPWKNLINRSIAVAKLLAETGDNAIPDPTALKNKTRNNIQQISWQILLDLANFIEKYSKTLWDAIESNSSAALRDDAKTLFDRLNHIKSKAVPAMTMREALVKARRFGDAGFDKITEDYDQLDSPADPWPKFVFRLTDPEPSKAILSDHDPVPSDPEDTEPGDVLPATPVSDADKLGKRLFAVDNLIALVVRATLAHPSAPAAAEPAVPIAARKPFSVLDGTFIIRCVFDRPNCGPLHPLVISEATEPFKLAGFFDPDAPARPIRIGLPLDTTPAGLRKFDKNAAFVMSDILCGQMKRVRGITLGDLVRSVLPFPLHSDISVPGGGKCEDGNGSLGMVCSISIPIITICALIVLMIMVKLLDFIFQWMPYFIICFPLPGLNGKKPEE